MGKLNIFSNYNKQGKTDFSTVTIRYDATTPIEITSGDQELWITITTPEKVKYVLEIDCSDEKDDEIPF